MAVSEACAEGRSFGRADVAGDVPASSAAAASADAEAEFLTGSADIAVAAVVLAAVLRLAGACVAEMAEVAEAALTDVLMPAPTSMEKPMRSD